jgi:hypothetical protein
MEHTIDPPIPEMFSTKVMYKITTSQYIRVTSQVVEDFGEPKRRFRNIFKRAHVFLRDNKNPSIYTLGLDEIYSHRSMSVIISILRKRNIIDESGFFTDAFHKAYYLKYQHMYRVRDVLIEI